MMIGKRMVFLMGLTAMLLSLFGCGTKEKAGDTKTETVQTTESQSAESQSQTEDVQVITDAALTGFYYHQESDAMEPYYLILSSDGKYYLETLYTDPADEDTRAVSDPGIFDIFDLSDADPEDLTEIGEADVLSIKKALDNAGAGAWNGVEYEKNADPDMLDGGFSFELAAVYADGTKIVTDGRGSKPEGLSDIVLTLDKILQTYIYEG